MAARHVIGDAGLGDTTLNAVADQFFMAFAAGLAVIDHRNQLACFVVEIGVDAGEGANPASRRPSAGAFSVRDRDAFAAFHQGQDFAAGNEYRLEGFHVDVHSACGAPLGALSKVGNSYIGRLPV